MHEVTYCSIVCHCKILYYKMPLHMEVAESTTVHPYNQVLSTYIKKECHPNKKKIYKERMRKTAVNWYGDTSRTH